MAELGIDTHLACFVRLALPAHIHALWRCVAHTVRLALSERPIRLSNAGGGVSWLHVRVEPVPNYYAYRTYAQDRPD